MRSWFKKRGKYYLIAFVCLEMFIILYGCADELVLRPSRHQKDAGTARSQKIATAAGELEVYVDRSPACGDAEPKAYVLEFCGNGTRAEDVTAWLAGDRWKQFPVEIWCLNYPGYGQSEGKARLQDIPPAALMTYDRLKQGDETFADFTDRVPKAEILAGLEG